MVAKATKEAAATVAKVAKATKAAAAEVAKVAKAAKVDATVASKPKKAQAAEVAATDASKPKKAPAVAFDISGNEVSLEQRLVHFPNGCTKCRKHPGCYPVCWSTRFVPPVSSPAA